MSFRELRNFTEMMRSLGYHRLISMENFRTPNFELVADILDWLLHRFDPSCAVPDEITDEAHRVEFIKAVVGKVAEKTGTKLNPRKLYGADGYAVKELLKLATVLYDAQKSVSLGNPMPVEGPEESFGLSSKLSDLKSTRSLCSQIVETGAGLFELLQKEVDLRQDREKALRFLDGMSRTDSDRETEVVGRALNSMLGAHSQNLEQLKTMSEELQRDEKGLEQKIRKNKQELERCKKRLSSLVNVRPAFMDEYEQLEQEFERYYEQYVGRFRNLDYLEHEVDMLNKEEKERMEENERALKRMQKRLQEEEMRLLRGEEDEKSKARRRNLAAGRKSWMPPNTTVNGAMDAGDEDEEEGSDVSESDSDLPISVGGSGSEGEEGLHGREQGPVSLGGSGSDEGDILNDSDEDEDLSDDDPIGGGMRPRGGRFDDNF